MSHGGLGCPTTGLSKALAMGLVLIVCPSKQDEVMDFSAAWHTCDVSCLGPLHADLLQHLDIAVTQSFWVSDLGFG